MGFTESGYSIDRVGIQPPGFLTCKENFKYSIPIMIPQHRHEYKPWNDLLPFRKKTKPRASPNKESRCQFGVIEVCTDIKVLKTVFLYPFAIIIELFSLEQYQ
jgi:hypothetical protein